MYQYLGTFPFERKSEAREKRALDAGRADRLYILRVTRNA